MRLSNVSKQVTHIIIWFQNMMSNLFYPGRGLEQEPFPTNILTLQIHLNLNQCFQTLSGDL